MFYNFPLGLTENLILESLRNPETLIDQLSLDLVTNKSICEECIFNAM